MARPMYESKSDLIRENAVIDEFCGMHKLEKQKLPLHKRLTLLVTRKKE